MGELSGRDRGGDACLVIRSVCDRGDAHVVEGHGPNPDKVLLCVLCPLTSHRGVTWPSFLLLKTRNKLACWWNRSLLMMDIRPYVSPGLSDLSDRPPNRPPLYGHPPRAGRGRWFSACGPGVGPTSGRIAPRAPGPLHDWIWHHKSNESHVRPRLRVPSEALRHKSTVGEDRRINKMNLSLFSRVLRMHFSQRVRHPVVMLCDLDVIIEPGLALLPLGVDVGRSR
jgi:hypothetical protein